MVTSRTGRAVVGAVLLAGGLSLANFGSAQTPVPEPAPAPAPTPTADGVPALTAPPALLPAPPAPLPMAIPPLPPRPIAPAPATGSGPGAASPEAALKAILSGNTLLYLEGRQLTSEYYGADGRFADSTGAKGIWLMKDGKLCVADTDGNSCWVGVINGKSVMWYDEDGAYESTGNVIPGNPSGL